MAATKNISVLTPNGRRPIIKVSPNTTILQILEEACQKHNFNPDDYDLKHYNRILDVNMIFRYANISNNACLEMVQCKTPRKVSNVTICIQLEDGKRVTGEFPPHVNINKILKDLSIEYNMETAVIIYTQREIYSKDFESSTLKSLGLLSGKALFRLLHRDPEKSKEPAHVYAPLKPKVSKTEEPEDKKPKPHPFVDTTKTQVLDVVSIIKAEKGSSQKPNDRKKETINENKIKTVKEIFTTENKQVKKEEETPMEIDEKKDSETQQIIEEEIEELSKVEFLGERNALLFNQADVRAIHQNDIPDDNFFELTMNDAKILLRDAKKRQVKLEDSPLLTAAQSELEKDKERLNRLHKYQQAVIRIQFPNQLVLQGIFGPLETVQTIKDFVKDYLENPEADFTLYTAPPRCDLIAEERLFDQDLVPSAIVYYSGSSDLKHKIKSKLTDPTAANYQAIKTRLTMTRKDNASLDDDEDSMAASTSSATTTSQPVDRSNGAVDPQPGPSISRAPQQSSQKSKAPKWFKLSTK